MPPTELSQTDRDLFAAWFAPLATTAVRLLAVYGNEALVDCCCFDHASVLVENLRTLRPGSIKTITLSINGKHPNTVYVDR